MSNAVIWAVLQSKLSLPDQSGVTEATCIPNGDLELRSAHHSVNCVGATRQLASMFDLTTSHATEEVAAQRGATCVFEADARRANGPWMGCGEMVQGESEGAWTAAPRICTTGM